MKNTQLLSVVLSMILVLGVTAGPAFAQTDDDDDDTDEMKDESYEEHDDLEDERHDLEDERHDLEDERHDLDDRLERFCEMTDEEKRKLFADHPRLAQFSDRLANYCELSEEKREDAIDEFVNENFPEYADLDDLLDRFCEMTDEEKRQLLADHPRLAQFSDRLANYCELSEEEQDAIDDLIESHGDKTRDKIREYADGHDKDVTDMREKLERYCQMTDAEKSDYAAEHDKSEEHAKKMDRYCSLDEDARQDFIKENRDEYAAHMKEMMHGEMTERHHADYDRFCEMTDEELAASTFDAEYVKKASEWCEMTPEQREEYKKDHATDKQDFDGMSGMAKDRMSDVAKAKLSQKSDRLKAMIMSKHSISDERRDEIKMKYMEKHGELTDKIKSELKTKFRNHMASMKASMSEDRRAEIHDRVAEMKAFKAELREKSAEITNEEKQQLREEFIEKAKDMQLAWITPRIQMTAGVDSADVECREGYSLVMKSSNGVAMCLKADTALKMIDRGIAVPAN